MSTPASYEVQIHEIAQWSTSEKLLVSMTDTKNDEILCSIFTAEDVHPCDAAKFLFNTAQSLVNGFMHD